MYALTQTNTPSVVKHLPFAKTIFGFNSLNRGVISTIPIPDQWNLDYQKIALPTPLQPQKSIMNVEGNVIQLGQSQSDRFSRTSSSYQTPRTSFASSLECLTNHGESSRFPPLDPTQQSVVDFRQHHNYTPQCEYSVQDCPDKRCAYHKLLKKEKSREE